MVGKATPNGRARKPRESLQCNINESGLPEAWQSHPDGWYVRHAVEPSRRRGRETRADPRSRRRRGQETRADPRRPPTRLKGGALSDRRGAPHPPLFRTEGLPGVVTAPRGPRETFGRAARRGQETRADQGPRGGVTRPTPIKAKGDPPSEPRRQRGRETRADPRRPGRESRADPRRPGRETRADPRRRGRETRAEQGSRNSCHTSGNTDPREISTHRDGPATIGQPQSA
jgi:hypothetical protein